MDSEILNRINELIEAKKMNVRKLALEIDIPYTTLRSILLGDTNDMKLSVAKKIAKYFNITLDQLAGDENIDLEKIKFADIPSVDTNGLTMEHVKELQQIANYMKNKK